MADVEHRIYFYRAIMNDDAEWRRADVLRNLEAHRGDDQVMALGDDNYAWALVDHVPRGRDAGRLRFFRDRRASAECWGRRVCSAEQRKCGVPVLSRGTVIRMSAPHLHPEQLARQRIDAMLRDAGWVIQDYSAVDFMAAPGVAVREFMTPEGPLDYLLIADRKVVGSIEAKAEGHTLRSVENQEERYNTGFKRLIEKRNLPRYFGELPYQYVSTGTETMFTSRRDPIRRGREVFYFHRPETLAEWAQQEHSFRARLRQMPPVKGDGLRDIQEEALKQMELSLAGDKPKALAAITMGGGKTRLAVAESYRLLRFGGARRILFLVDRVSLGDQAEKEFLSFVSPDDGRRFGDLFGVQVLRSSNVSTSANVIICTIQRLYALLSNQEAEYDPELDEVSSFEVGDGEPVQVAYNARLPVEFFDLVWTDECHRSIYGRWGQVLDYFDAFVVGLTATPTPTTMAYFDDNVIAEYTQEQSVFDGVNVDQQLYRIRTDVGEQGATIEAGEWVKVRDKQTRAIDRKQLEDEFIYDPDKLDRAVVNYSQIRTVVRTFKERVQTEIFPERDDVPKTIFFCKHDQHAEDVLKVIREEFDRGNSFAKKITYKAEGSVEENINQFRNDPQLRVAVTVEQIGTGTDIKAVECLVFMRMVGSRVLLNQMRGRAVRTMNETDFWQVTPGAQEKGQTKEYSVLIDCVGLTDEDVVIADTAPVSESHTVPLKNLLRDIGMGLTDDGTLRSAGLRLVRLHNKLSDAEREEFEHTAGGTRMLDMVHDLRKATDLDFQLATAREQTGKDEPDDAEVAAARELLVEHAVAQLRRGEVREKIEQLQAEVTEQYIHIGGHDRLIDAGFIESADEATGIVTTWRQFVDEHHDEYLALKAFYAEPYRRRPSLAEVKELAAAIARPPHNLTTERIWSAYEKLEADRVRGHGGKLDADLVRVIRYTLEQDDELVPHKEVVNLRFDLWLAEQEQAGRKFNDEQMRWLTMVRDYIANSMTFDPTEDFDFAPFSEHGGATAAYQLFGNDLNTVVEQLNEALAAA